MKIKVGFSRRKGFAPLSWLIMLCERTAFSHVFVEFYSKSLDRKLVYHAAGSGVTFVGEKVFTDNNTVIKEKELCVNDAQYANLLSWCVDQAGKPYSQMQIFCIFIRRVLSLVGIKLRVSPSNDTAKYICSELVARALIEAGFHPEVEELDTLGLKELEILLSTI